MLFKGQRVWGIYATAKSSWDGQPQASVTEYEVVEPEYLVLRPVFCNGQLGERTMIKDVFLSSKAAWKKCGEIISDEIDRATKKMHECFAQFDLEDKMQHAGVNHG